MSIKSDKWIRRMSLEKEMIQPFESNQLRHVNDNKIISYGTSSYGYDVRCSTELRYLPTSITTLSIQKTLTQKVL